MKLRRPRFSVAARVAAWIICGILLLLYLIGPPQPPPRGEFSVTSTTGGTRWP